MKKILLLASLALGLVIVSCGDDFLDKAPQGSLNPATLANADGVEALLISAYSLLDGWEGGWSTGGGASWNAAASNWTYGDVYSDDAYKGTEAGDQPALELLENYTIDASNPYLIGRWARIYDGIARSNDVINVAEAAADLDEATRAIIIAEARFLRGHYHFEAQRLWDNVPFISEADAVADVRVTNPGEIWAEIEADFAAAVSALPADSRNGQVGRVNRISATAYLGKVQLYQQNYGAALGNFNTVINSGKYALQDNFGTNFRIEGNNGIEAVFQIQASVNDGAGANNGNHGDQLNGLQGGPRGGCCGFHQPSQNLVNLFQTENGLPIANFNAVDLTNDDGITADQPFTPHAGPIDPRLDRTVGRRGIPYLDWGTHPGAAWVRNQAYAGPYSAIKKTYLAAELGTGSDTQAAWHGAGNTSLNHNIIRYADVLLMAAEAEVETGSLENARALVNQVRARAANPASFVQAEGGGDAANYVISTYDDAWTNQGAARDAVRTERRLELAMEGHRFFDLKRWGVAQSVLNDYLAEESTKRSYLTGASFQARNIRFPIPQEAIDESSDDDGNATLTQNEGF